MSDAPRQPVPDAPIGEVKVERRPIANPGTTRCPSCHSDVSLPDTDPYLIIGGRELTPHLQSFLCTSCGARIYLREVSDEQRAEDAERDAARKAKADAAPDEPSEPVK